MSHIAHPRLVRKFIPVAFVIATGTSILGVMQASSASAETRSRSVPQSTCTQDGLVGVPGGIVNAGGNSYPRARCTNQGAVPLRSSPTANAPIVNTLRTTKSWFACGMATKEGIWVATQGDDNINWGWTRSNVIHETIADGTTPGIVNCFDGKIAIPAGGVGALAVKAAETKQGKPYVWGAKGPNSFDCSGLVLWSYKQAGISLPTGGPRISRAMGAALKDQGKAIPQPTQAGDLIFYGSPIVHVAMYTGVPGQMVEAGGVSNDVHVTKLRTNWNMVARP